MGGMIVQLAAATYPEKVLSVVSFMSTTNEPSLPGPTLNVLLYLLTVSETTKEGAIRERVKFMKMIGSPGYPRSDEMHLEYARKSIERSFRPKAGLLHKIAVLATGGFADRSATIQAPTLIIHGDQDPLVRVQGGKACAKVIPNAKLKIIEGMGHNFPDELVLEFARMMISHMAEATPLKQKAA
jgi:pimeloyl-ACP methyl ester carboxylesterase